ncbi:MAG: hypothetical protein H6Q58_2079 [Firmicutes bacterium]|nr:hypothetical protein [Bacillota bacterium]
MKNVFAKSISQILKGAVKAFKTFPAAIASALGFAIVTMIRIQLDWPQQEAYNFLFNCLHWSFALGSVFGLAAITAARSRYEGEKAFKLANLISVAVVAVTFLLLYLFAADYSDAYAARYATVSGLAAARVGVAMLVSGFAFVILAAYPKEQSDFSRSLFMTQKAFFIALIYGGVIMAGTSAVAGAFEALIYRDMSEKVYQYIATIVFFLAFTIFAGYFPDFRKGQVDEKREIAQKQPRFVEILFEYIMVPIMLALTAVLLVWAGRSVLTGEETSFVQLSGIATSFAVAGIWLHMMVTSRESGLAKFYRRFYPIAALLILAFEAWALVEQVSRYGIKMTSYSFAVLWIIAVSAAVLLLAMKAKSHTVIALITCALAVFSVLPLVGYHALPVASQVSRLEKLLVSQDMLQDDKLIPAASEPEKAVRQNITDAVNYLATAEDAKLPAWFDTKLVESDTFREKLGFDQTWPEPEYPDGSGDYVGTYLSLQNGAVDISGYRWVVKVQNFQSESTGTATLKGDKGAYKITWIADQKSGSIPKLKIELDNRVILEQDMSDFVRRLTEKYPPGQGGGTEATFDDMSLKLETPEVSVMLVFNNIEINVDRQQDMINYFMNLSEIYMNEK